MSNPPLPVSCIAAALETAIVVEEIIAGKPPAAELTSTYNVVDQFGNALTVGPSGDGLDLVCAAFTEAAFVGDTRSIQERTGPVTTFTPEVARKFALALLKAADDAEVAAARYAR